MHQHIIYLYSDLKIIFSLLEYFGVKGSVLSPSARKYLQHPVTSINVYLSLMHLFRLLNIHCSFSESPNHSPLLSLLNCRPSSFFHHTKCLLPYQTALSDPTHLHPLVSSRLLISEWKNLQHPEKKDAGWRLQGCWRYCRQMMEGCI